MIAVFLFAAAAWAVPAAALAGGVDLGLNYATAIGLATTDIRTTVGNIIRAFFALLGIIAVVLVLYAGFLWMTSGGNEEKISQAKRILTNAVIGLIIIMSAYAITAFIFRAITGEGLGGAGGGGGGAGGGGFITDRTGRRELGNGIIEYHYPENGQGDVPRNTKIAITFKKPLVLSTVFLNYDDGGTAATDDDFVCDRPCAEDGATRTAVTPRTILRLNAANIKIIPQQFLGPTSSGATVDERFDNRYPGATAQQGGAIVDPAPRANATVLAASPFDPNERQTITFKPGDLGSPNEPVNYRVALRGGAGGIRIWAPKLDTDPAETPDPKPQDAFADFSADGSYYWSFATGTTFDTTPPRITGVAPFTVRRTRLGDDDAVVYRNQVLMVYFNEPMDPTSASGLTGEGEGRGFDKIEVRARCRSNLPQGETCDFADEFRSIGGAVTLGNRYMTAEFLPDTPCDTVSVNSCGEKVYCLPRNVELRVTVKAASVSADVPPNPEPPEASAEDGVLDMVGNSFDGNKDGAAQGPSTPDNDNQHYPMNPPEPTALTGIRDSARWFYFVGNRVDLTPPAILTGDLPGAAAITPLSRSTVPPTAPILITWSKGMQPSSMRTGRVNDVVPTGNEDPVSSVALQADECRKRDQGATCSPGNCPCDPVPPAPFTVRSSVPTPETPYSVMAIDHSPFLTANDLGYTEADKAAMGDSLPVPKYAPVVGAQVRDERQNCFYPSHSFACTQGSTDFKSCCDASRQDGFYCPP